MKFLSDILARAGLVVDGTVTLNSVANATTDTDRFIVVDSGVVKYRTGTQLLSDIGGISGNQTITLSGDATGSGTTAIAVTLANSGVTAGTYNNVTVNAKGLVTSGSNVSYLTSYTETDTLATVTARGASTSTRTTFVEVGVTRNGADTIGDGPWFRWTNADTSRQMLTQLNASNGLTTWAYNGSTWSTAFILSQAGAGTFSSSVTATSFIRSGGTSSQFLKADGSVDSSTYATQTFVNTQISNLVNSAPATLDTLNELATALGNDANFSTTVTNSIATRVPQSRTLTINGTTFDLSADRSWSITAGVSSVSAGSGISVSSTTGAITVTNTGILSASAGSGISVSTSGGTLSISNTGLLSALAGSGISVSTSGGTLSISNTGILSGVAGSGISVTTSGGTLSISNTGLLSASAGSGISVSTSGGTVSISNTGVLSVVAGSGISVSTSGGTVTVSNTVTQYTDALARAAISLTTLGTSGPATYNSTTGVLNIPQYQPAGSYLTAESDTLATVTARGATTSTGVTFNGSVNTGGANGIELGWTGSTINDQRIGRIRPISTPSQNPYAGGLAFDYYKYSGTQYQFYEGIRLSGAGYVGIGTSSPSHKLHIVPEVSSDTIDALCIESNWGSISNHMVRFDGNVSGTGDGNVLLVRGGGTRTDTEIFEVQNGSGTQFVVRGDGNIGINTTTPGFKLDVNGTLRIANTLRIDGFDSVSAQRAIGFGGNTLGTNAVIYSNGSYISISAATNQPVYINGDTNGNVLMNGSGLVGVGTASPSAKLNISGISSGTSIRTDHTASYSILYSYINGGSPIAFDNTSGNLDVFVGGNPRLRVGTGGQLRFHTYTSSSSFTGTPAGYLAFDSSGNIITTAAAGVGGSGTTNYVARWTSSSALGTGVLYDDGTNVGIGTTNPTNLLTIRGASAQVDIQSTADSQVPGIWMRYQNNADAGTKIYYSTGDAIVYYDNLYPYTASTVYGSHNFRSKDSGGTLTSRLYIQGFTGNVGIGTVSPEGRLDVVGNISYVGNTNNSVFVVRNNTSFTSGGGSGSTFILQYGGQNIITMANTGTGQRDAILAMRDEGVVKVRIAANNSRGGDTYFNGGGNFGIGTDNPANKLQIGSVGSSGYGGNDIVIGNGTGVMAFYQTNTVSTWYTNTNFSLMPAGAGGVGNLAVGTSTASNRLTVSGSADITNALFVGYTTAEYGEKLRVNGGVTTYHTYTQSGTLSRVGNVSQLITTTAGGAGYYSGLTYTAFTGAHENTFNGSVTIPNSVTPGGINSSTGIKFAATNATVTLTQSGSFRAYSGVSSLIAPSATATGGSISHVAAFHALGPYYVGSNTPTITNYFGLLLNDSAEYSTYVAVTNRWGIYQHGSGDNNYFAGKVMVGTTTVPTQLMYVNGTSYFNGNMTVNGTITELSTINIKTNVETLDGALDKVEKMRGVSYNRKDNHKKEIGFIAEEVDEVYPEFVEYDEQGKPVGLHYARLTAVLLQSVKELSGRIKELEKRN